MSQTLKTTFATRRDAELAVERLVQEHGVERSDIFIAPEGDANSAGEAVSGSDQPTAAPTEAGRSRSGPEAVCDLHRLSRYAGWPVLCCAGSAVAQI